MEPSYYLPPIVVPRDRTSQQRLKLYTDEGEPATFEASDNFRLKVWAVGNATPVIDSDEADTTSRVEVVTNGTPGTTPAEVVCHFHEDETDGLTAGGEYLFELLVWDNSASVNRSICQGPVIVPEITGGDVGA